MNQSLPKHHMLKYLREEILPTLFCQGCGCGTVLNVYTRAVDELQLDPKTIVTVAGIGCSSWIPSPYFKADTLHATHGRAIAFATGIKVMKPEMKVIVIAGDGDLMGIGGNHLIHAARRNLDVSVFLVNNFIYAMTGGQFSSTTPCQVKTTTTPYENIETPFDIAGVVAAAGANYVSRWTTYNVFPLMESMQKAIQKKGFSFIEIISQCPTNDGRRREIGNAADFLTYFKKNSIRVEQAKTIPESELAGKIVIGKLVDRNRTDFISGLRNVNKLAQRELT